MKMDIRKFFLTIVIVFSLSLSFQPVNVFAKEKESIVFIIDSRNDNFTSDFIKRNETRKHAILVSLTIKVLIFKYQTNYINTS